jgi:hypothetical protein
MYILVNNNNLELIKFIHSIEENLPIYDDAVKICIRNDYIKLLKYLLSINVNPSKDDVDLAYNLNKLEIIKIFNELIDYNKFY